MLSGIALASTTYGLAGCSFAPTLDLNEGSDTAPPTRESTGHGEGPTSLTAHDDPEGSASETGTASSTAPGQSDRGLDGADEQTGESDVSDVGSSSGSSTRGDESTQADTQTATSENDSESSTPTTTSSSSDDSTDHSTTGADESDAGTESENDEGSETSASDDDTDPSNSDTRDEDAGTSSSDTTDDDPGTSSSDTDDGMSDDSTSGPDTTTSGDSEADATGESDATQGDELGDEEASSETTQNSESSESDTTGDDSSETGESSSDEGTMEGTSSDDETGSSGDADDSFTLAWTVRVPEVYGGGAHVTSDPWGYLYVISTYPAQNGSIWIWIGKFAPNGEREWEHRHVGKATETGYATDITMDPDGDVVVSGFVGNADSAWSDSAPTDAWRPWLARVHSNGEVAWQSDFESPLPQTQALSVAVDSSGDIIFGGRRRGGDVNEVWVAKRKSRDGALLWEWAQPATLGPSNEAIGYDWSPQLVMGRDDRPWAAVVKHNGVSLDLDLFAFSVDGEPLPSTSLDLGIDEVPVHFVADAHGKLIVAGYEFDSSGNRRYRGFRDEGWLAKFDANGDRQWVLPTEEGFVSDMDTDAIGNIYLTRTRSVLDDETDPLVWMISYDPEGNERWRWEWTRDSDSLGAFEVVPDIHGNLFVVRSEDRRLAIEKYELSDGAEAP